MGLGTVTKRSNVINEVARVADEKASVHSVIRLFGRSAMVSVNLNNESLPCMETMSTISPFSYWTPF
jgi:hypothetical protein